MEVEVFTNSTICEKVFLFIEILLELTDEAVDNFCLILWWIKLECAKGYMKS